MLMPRSCRPVGLICMVILRCSLNVMISGGGNNILLGNVTELDIIAHTYRTLFVLQQGLHVTSVGWSKSGAVLCASFGDCDAYGWCTKPGFLCTWRVDRLDRDSKPNFIAEAPAPLMFARFHPDLTSIVAGGTFSGKALANNGKANETCHH